LAIDAIVNRLVVNIGDVIEVEGRLYDVVPDKQGGATLEPAIRMTVAEIHAAHGERALTSVELEAYFGDVPSDGEG
jgi:hypothetical protein